MFQGKDWRGLVDITEREASKQRGVTILGAGLEDMMLIGFVDDDYQFTKPRRVVGDMATCFRTKASWMREQRKKQWQKSKR